MIFTLSAQAIKAMHFPVLLMLVLLFFQAGQSVLTKSLRWMAAAWSLNLPHVWMSFTSDAKNPVSLKIAEVNVADVIASLATICIINAYRSSKRDVNRRVPLWLYASIVVAIGTIDLIIIPQRLFGSTMKLHAEFDAVISAFFLCLLAHSYHIHIVRKYLSRNALTWFLPAGLAAFGILQLLQFWPPAGVQNGACVYLLSLITKLCTLYGVVEILSLIAAEATLELERLDEAKKTIAELYHELGTPLAEISLRTSALLGDRRVDSASRQHAIMAENAGQRILAILQASENSSLMIALKDALKRLHGQIADVEGIVLKPQVPQVIFVNAILELAYLAVTSTRRSEIAAQAKNKIPIEFVHSYAGKCCAHVVPSQLGQLFVIFLNNALDASPADRKGLIAISTSRTSVQRNGSFAEYVVITIRDRGEGIQAHPRDRIYESRYTTRPGEGRGHGLFIAKKIVEQNGWTLTHESPYPSDGRTGCLVTLQIPSVNCPSKLPQQN